MSTDEVMDRCIQLARLGTGNTRTNPMVGCVIMHQGRIIGEGYHKEFGNQHAEIEAIRSIDKNDLLFLPSSILYVTLEPCSHQGKTPPCADEIIRLKIPQVIIGQMDPNPKVNGKGIEKMRAAGINVEICPVSKQMSQLNKSFNKNMTNEFPYIILKYACSQDGYIGNLSGPISISNDWSKYLVHKMRSTVDAILIGTNTAVTDNPMLTNRLYYGKHPIRIVLDRNGKIPSHFHLLQDGYPTWLFTDHPGANSTEQVKIFPFIYDLSELLQYLFSQGIGTILVEGGAQTLQSFIDHALWDELWMIQSEVLLKAGIKAPESIGQRVAGFDFRQDKLSVFIPSD